jgi:hypothetical protein
MNLRATLRLLYWPMAISLLGGMILTYQHDLYEGLMFLYLATVVCLIVFVGAVILSFLSRK